MRINNTLWITAFLSFILVSSNKLKRNWDNVVWMRSTVQRSKHLTFMPQQKTTALQVAFQALCKQPQHLCFSWRVCYCRALIKSFKTGLYITAFIDRTLELSLFVHLSSSWKSIQPSFFFCYFSLVFFAFATHRHSSRSEISVDLVSGWILLPSFILLFFLFVCFFFSFRTGVSLLWL